MKKILIIIVLTLLASLSTAAQVVTGDWYGKVTVAGNSLRLNIHITEQNGSYNGSLDSPDQNAYGIKASFVSFFMNILTMNVGNINYTATLKEDRLVGTFKQGNIEAEMIMTHEPILGEERIVIRPQTPKEPFPYLTEEVTFKGSGNYKLAGTLTLPQGMKTDTPIVVMVSGSGPQDRDENIFDHKPFAVIADALARKGIASLRYDDRGTAASEGDFADGTSEDNIADAESAIAFLRLRGYTKIGALGHSEGGMIVAALSARDSKIAFIISLAGPGVNGAEISKRQQKDMNEAAASPQAIIELNSYTAKVLDCLVQDKIYSPDKAAKVIEEICSDIPVDLLKAAGIQTVSEFITLMKQQICGKWALHFAVFDPAVYWKQVQCPVLALNGKKDLQVHWETNLSKIRQYVDPAKAKLEVKAYEGLNHLFQHCSLGLSTEYQQIEETFSTEVLDDIISFILSEHI